MKPIYTTLLTILCGIIAILTLIPAHAVTHSQKPTPLNGKQIQQWNEDIDFMWKELEWRHIQLYHTITPELFATQLTQIKQQLPQLTETELSIQLMHLIKQIGDGHTQFAYWGSTYHRYPLELRLFDKKLRLISIEHEHRHLLGATLVAINDVTIEKVQSLLNPILQGVENIYSNKQRLVEHINVAEVLQGLNISTTLHQSTFTFMQSTGELQQIHLNSLSMDRFQHHAMASIRPATPATFVMHKISIDGIDLLLGNDGKIVYLDFHQYPSFAAMQSFADDLIQLLRKEKTREVIIDLRNNSGGDFFVGLQLAWALIMVDNLNWRDGIYVLTGRKTFSAAMSNAAQYRQLLNATLVGEPTGANPVGYQDAGSFSLPHSGWKILYSKRRYRFQDSASAGLIPDIEIALDWDAYAAGKDNQLAWVLHKIQSHRSIK